MAVWQHRVMIRIKRASFEPSTTVLSKRIKDAPLYKIRDDGEVKKFAIDIKEHTRSIQNVIASLSDEEIQAVHFTEKLPSQPMKTVSVQSTLARIRM